MRNVAIVGNSGSGKSSLAAALAVRLGVPHVELDSIFHQADWQPLDAPEFRDRVDRITAADGWVIDGNYRAVRDLIWARADTIVWLDLPRWTVTRQIVRRSFGRVVRNAELWNGNRERWRNLMSLNPERSVIVWSITKHSHYRRQFAELLAGDRHGAAEVVRLRSRRAIRDFAAVAGRDAARGPDQ
jgi:adenylate kinase family enzyme